MDEGTEELVDHCRYRTFHHPRRDNANILRHSLARFFLRYQRSFHGEGEHGATVTVTTLVLSAANIPKYENDAEFSEWRKGEEARSGGD